MILWRDIRAFLAVLLATSLACSPAHALVTFNDGHDKIHVSAGISVSHDSNVFANSDDRGDYVYSTSLSAQYTRRAGWIGVNATAGLSTSQFATIEGQDFNNPNFGLEFTKQSGRTTGSLTLSAARESRADAAVNLRSTSWNIPVGLNFKYPIVGTYTLVGGLGYSSRRYLDETVFASLATYHAAVDLMHILTTERDVMAGYRYRFSETSRHSSSTDHSASLGLSGRLIRGINGNLRVGYQTRISDGLRDAAGRRMGRTSYDSWTASGSATYALGKKIHFIGSLAKDFSTTATDASVDTTSVNLDGQYAYSSHLSFGGSVSFGDSQYLGENGRVVINAGPPPLLGPQRHDNYLNWTGSLNYSLNDHLRAAFSYSWFQNWSTASFGDFVRSAWTLTVSTNW
jgi:hypothetical protein